MIRCPRFVVSAMLMLYYAIIACFLLYFSFFLSFFPLRRSVGLSGSCIYICLIGFLLLFSF